MVGISMEALLDARLDRVEKKLDEMHQTLVAVVRVEERLVSHTQRQATLEKRIEYLETNLQRMREERQDKAGFLRASERIFWIIVAGIVSFVSWKIR